MIDRAVLSGLVVAAASGSVRAQDTYADRVRAAMLETVGVSAPAIAVAVVKQGEVVVAEAVGAARIKAKLKADATTLFPLGTASRVVSGMALARLSEANALDLDSKINELLAPMVIDDEDGGATNATLRDLVFGRVRTPVYRNDVAREALGTWNLERALGENCWIQGKSGSRTALSWAIVQAAVERATRSSWGDVVAAEVAKPLELSTLHGDLTGGRPANSVDLHREGAFGLPALEPNAWSSFLAERGSWIGVQDLGSLLLALVQHKPKAKGEAGVDELTERLEFQHFYTWQERGQWSLRLADGCSGSFAAIQIYPDSDFAFAYLVSRFAVFRPRAQAAAAM